MPESFVPAPWIITAASAIAGSGGVWGWLSLRAKLKQIRDLAEAAAPADLATAYASFARTLNEQAEAFIRALQAERASLVQQVSELRRQIDRLSEDHELCLGENRQLRQRLDSLERKLSISGALTVIEGDGATVTMPSVP